MIITDRNQTESYAAFLKRIVHATSNKQITYTEMGDALLGAANVYSSENLRKAFYVLEKICDNIDGDACITDNDIIREIELQKDELYKERVRYRDKLREFNKKLTTEARFENLRDVMLEELRKSSSFGIIEKDVCYEPTNTEASLLISDIHYGIRIDNQFNYYDTIVAKERIEELVNKTILYCELHKVQRLNVEILGDVVSGLIQLTGRVEQEEDIITQVINSGEMLAEAILLLNKRIPEVVVYTVFGNHSRVSQSKADNLNRENFERLVYYHIKEKLKGIRVVNSMSDDYLLINIADKKILLEHGDKSNNPVTDYTNLLNIELDEIHRGHFHAFAIKNDNDCIIVTNGSVVGTDDYALSIRKSTKASQILRIYGSDITTYELILQ